MHQSLRLPVPRVLAAVVASTSLVLGSAGLAAGIGSEVDPAEAAASPDHLVISEVMTGGASASDEFVEIYNPAGEPLSLVGVELIYVSASGSTVTRRATWESGSIPPFEHLLVANEAGIFASIADVRYAGGASSTGGSVALRREGAQTAIDAVGWGTATNAWKEGTPASAPPVGASIERLPGGRLGSGFDTDENSVDFVVREQPEPENSASLPAPSPTSSPASPVPSPTATTSRSPSPSATPATSVTPAPAAVPISVARTQPSGSRTTISGVALTSSSFNDGGGYVADDTAGIAVLVSGTSFERGERLQLSGEVANRYHQWTLRAEAAGVSRLGVGSDPAAEDVTTGEAAEAHEARLVRLSGTIAGSPVELSSGVAYELDDGSGGVRVLVLRGTGIDTAEWRSGHHLELRGVVGQRDSSGTGMSGYRVQPRDSSDVVSVRPPSAAPSASSTPPSSGGTRTPSEDARPLVTVGQARDAAPGSELRVRGVVTAATGRLVDDRSAIIQDPTGGLLLRLSADHPFLERGSFIEVSGERSTKAGMSTLRVDSIVRLGEQAEPEPARLTTGAAGEEHEGELVVVRGLVSTAVRESSAGSVSFDLDDGSGPRRIFAFASTEISAGSVERGAWLEVRGVLGQETSGDRPADGYRVWPRDPGDMRLIAPAMPEATDDAGTAEEGDGAQGRNGSTGADGSGRSASATSQDLEAVLGAAGGPGTARATLVTGAWPELGLAGVLWDGQRSVGISEVGGATNRLRDAVPMPPRVVEVHGAARPGQLGPFEGMVLELDIDVEVRVVGTGPVPPATEVPPRGELLWGRAAGTLEREAGALTITSGDTEISIDYACDRTDAAAEGLAEDGTVVVDGLLGVTDGGVATLVVPCGAIHVAPVLGTGFSGAVGEPGAPAAEDARLGPHRPPNGPAPALLAGGATSLTLLTVLATLAWRLGTIGRLIAAYRSASTVETDSARTTAEG